MKQFNCGDVVPGCTWVTRREDEDGAVRGDLLTRARGPRDGRGPARGHGPHPRRDHRGLGAAGRRRGGTRRARGTSSSAAAVRRELEALIADPRVAVVGAGVAIAAVADQGDDAAALATREHLGDEQRTLPRRWSRWSRRRCAQSARSRGASSRSTPHPEPGSCGRRRPGETTARAAGVRCPRCATAGR